jgi:hypothetical protein
VTFGNTNALVDLQTDKTSYNGATDKNFIVSADFISTTPGLPMRAKVTGGVNGAQLLLDTLIQPNTKDASHILITRPLAWIGSGAQSIGLSLQNTQGISLLETSAPISVANVTLPIYALQFSHENFSIRVLPEGNLRLRFADTRIRYLEIFNLRGERLLQTTLSGSTDYAVAGVRQKGLLWAQIREEGKSSRQFLGIATNP